MNESKEFIGIQDDGLNYDEFVTKNRYANDRFGTEYTTVIWPRSFQVRVPCEIRLRFDHEPTQDEVDSRLTEYVAKTIRGSDGST